MCKDHDLQHYAIDLRDAAREICCEDHTLASQLLEEATFDGLAAFWQTYGIYCENARRERVEGMLKRGYRQRCNGAIVHAGEIVNLWDAELADLIPY